MNGDQMASTVHPLTFWQWRRVALANWILGKTLWHHLCKTGICPVGMYHKFHLPEEIVLLRRVVNAADRVAFDGEEGAPTAGMDDWDELQAAIMAYSEWELAKPQERIGSVN